MVRRSTNVRIDKKRYRHALVDKDISQKNFAKLAGVHEATLCRISSGKALRRRTAEAIAAALGVEVETITEDGDSNEI